MLNWHSHRKFQRYQLSKFWVEDCGWFGPEVSTVMFYQLLHLLLKSVLKPPLDTNKGNDHKPKMIAIRAPHRRNFKDLKIYILGSRKESALGAIKPVCSLHHCSMCIIFTFNRPQG